MQLPIHLLLLQVFLLQLLNWFFLSNTGAGKKQHQRTSCKYPCGTVKKLQNLSLKRPLAVLLVEEAGGIIFVSCLAVSKQNSWFIPL